MRNIWLIAHWEYWTRLRSKWFIISTLIIPLILIGFMFLPGLMMQDEGSHKVIAIVAETPELDAKCEALLHERYRLKDGSPKYQVISLKQAVVDSALRQARALLDSMVIDAFIHLPENVLDSNKVLYFARYLGNYRDQGEIQGVVNSVVMEERVKRAGLDQRVVRELTRRVRFEMVEISRGETRKYGNEFLTYLLPIIFVLMLYFAIVMSAQVLLRSVLEERTNRLVELLLSSVTPTQLMSGKIIGLGLLGLTQLGFYLVCGWTLSAYQNLAILPPNQTVFFLIYFILGYMFYASIFAAIGAVFSSEHDAQQAVSLFSIVSVLPIMLSSYVVTNPSSLLTSVMAHIPFMTPFLMIMLIGIETPPLWQFISTAALMIVAALAAMIIAGKIFRTAILMYGKRPTLAEIWQWLKA